MKIISCCLLFFLVNQFTFCQSGKIIYKTTSNLQIENVPEDMREFQTKINENVNSQEFELQFNTTSSYFKIKTKINEASDDERYIANVAQAGFTTNATTYVNLVKDSIYEVMSNGIITKTKSETKNWNITTETKIIDNYTCYKAIYIQEYLNRLGQKADREIVAWFAPALPYRFGPRIFYGLPGLILELTEKKITYLVSSIITYQEEIPLAVPKGKFISKEEYRNKIKNQMGF